MNSRPWMIGLLLIMALICSTALALIDMQTSPIIKRQQELAYMSTVLDVFKISYNAEDPEEIIGTFRDRIVEEARAFAGGDEHADDLTVVVVRRL